MPQATALRQRIGKAVASELGVAALLAAVAALVLIDTATMSTGFGQRGPLGPKAVPMVVGALLLATAVLLAIDVLRGGRGRSESGEDVDLSKSSDWRTVGLLAAVFALSAILIRPLGFPIAGALLFWGTARTLGSRRPVLDPVISLVLSFGGYLAFTRLLGIGLPAGVLNGVI